MPELGSDYTVITGCRSCGAKDLVSIIEFGPMPLSDALFPPGQSREGEPRYPLSLVFCAVCSLVQIKETVRPETLFGEEYPYYSSFSPALVDHSRRNVSHLLEMLALDGTSLVVEIASNDGYLLQWFQKAGIPVLGIDPAPGPASTARERGIPTISEFFDLDLARRLAKEGQRADLIVGNNVLAHVPNQNELIEAMGELLKPEGTIVMEFPYVRDLIEHGEFDTVYHEHHCYFSVASVQSLFARHELTLTSVQRLAIHGGSLRTFFSRKGPADSSVSGILEEEERAGVHTYEFYEAFSERVQKRGDELVSLLEDLKADGSRIAAYGAAAKGAILLNYLGIDGRFLDYVVDRNTHKHGWEMPGIPLPIAGPERLLTEPVDYLLLLAWNFKEEIMSQQSEFAARGGQFIVPMPRPMVV
ncbi:MAG: class I SAM-dependent methyltransferase [Acidimicrobiia bacterium]|nr:class I SAM-dependent methyltransferase [Acidimicrobiia bacterium]